MKRIANILILLTVLVFLLSSCKPKSTAKSKKVITAKQLYWNHMVKFLAGQDVPTNSVFAKKTDLPFWKEHQKKMDAYWKEVELQTLSPIKDWVSKNIPASNPDITVFYPLSGADILNAYLFFPDAKNYLLTALEETGPIPEPLKLSNKDLAQGLQALRQVISRYGVFNYFTSKGMGEKMANKYFSGTMPVFLILLSRLGFSVDKIEKIDLNKDGNTVVWKQNNQLSKTKQKLARGLKIYFHSQSDETNKSNRTLSYFNWRLSDKMVSEVNPVSNYLNKQKAYYTFMKSAVYLLQMDSFIGLKNFVLSKSIRMVQDDTGIAYRDFSKEKWDIYLFGKYEPFPIKGCIYKPQLELKAAFATSTPLLPFHFGYGSMKGKHKSNLMLAIRKENLK